MGQSTVHFDEDLKEAAKMIGGHGIVSEVCNEALRQFVSHDGDPEVLPIAARQRIDQIRERIELARNEERIIHDCWEELVKARMSPIIARYGVRKKTLEPVIEEAKMWLFEKYGRLPPDDEIATRFREYYAGETLYWGSLRADVFRIALLKDQRLKDECHEMGKQIAATAGAMLENPHV
jgi:hypothetical protein